MRFFQDLRGQSQNTDYFCLYRRFFRSQNEKRSRPEIINLWWSIDIDTYARYRNSDKRLLARSHRKRYAVISAEHAQQLKASGLEWQPAERDLFIMPEHNLEGQIFVVSALPALVQTFGGQRTITFHGSIEWALDYVVLAEAVWLPSETQLRELLSSAIGPEAPMRLERLATGYRLLVGIGADVIEFESLSAEECYAQALLRALG